MRVFNSSRREKKRVDGARESGVVLTGDGPFYSPGHYEKYCTDTLLYVDSKKVVGFKVVSVIEVANSIQME